MRQAGSGDTTGPLARTAGTGSRPPVAPRKQTRTFEALQYRDYRRLFIAGLFIFLAVQAQQVVRGWLAAELTGSNKGLGGVFFGFAIPALLFSPVGGVAADRFPKRTVLVVSTSLLVGSALWIGLADAFGVLEYWMLIGAAAIQAASFATYGPARISMTSDLVGRDVLPNAIILSQISMNSTRILGPAVGGALIGVHAVGTAGTYLITAGLMFVALLYAFSLPRTPATVRPDRPGPVAELTEGIRYVRRNRPVMYLMITAYMVMMSALPYVAFLPTLATDLFDVGSVGFGAMNAVSGVAAVAVSLRIAGRTGDPWRTQLLGGLAFGAGVILLGLAPSFWVALLTLLLVGGAASAFQAMNNTLILTESEPSYHGRVQSLLMLSFSGFGMAALPLGTLADSIGLRPVLVGMGTVAVLTMVVYQAVRTRWKARTADGSVGVDETVGAGTLS